MNIDEIFNQSIDRLDLDAKLLNKLKANGYNTICDILSCDPAKLYELRGFTSNDFNIVRSSIVNLGLACSKDIDTADLYNLNIMHLDLTTRAYNCLRNAGVNTIGELVNHTEKELFNLRDMGTLSFDEIVAEINRLGLSLKGNSLDV